MEIDGGWYVVGEIVDNYGVVGLCGYYVSINGSMCDDVYF